MTTEANRTGPSRGKFWRKLSVSDAAGQPLAEWAYYSPRFPDGIGVSDLAGAPIGVQREIALIWFWSNFKPYELGAGPYFGFAELRSGETVGLNTSAFNTVPFGDGAHFSDGSSFTQSSPPPMVAGFDRAPFAPVPLAAAHVLDTEFAGILGDDVRRGLVDDLAGDWMQSWNEHAALAEFASAQLSHAGFQAAILARLDLLAREVRELGPTHGAIGHNVAPDGLPLTAQEQAEAEDVIERAKAVIASNDASRSGSLTFATESLTSLSKKIGAWVLRQLDTFITEANKSVARDVGKIIIAVLAVNHLKEITELIELVERVVGR